MASVPREAASGLILALKAAGYRDAAVVGEIVAREEGEFAPLVELSA